MIRKGYKILLEDYTSTLLSIGWLQS